MINLRTLPAAESYESRLAYLAEFRRPMLSLSNPVLDLGVDLEWDLEAWPYLWYSLEAGQRSGFPWFHNGYFLALTPCSSWPAHGLHDARRVSSSTEWIDADAEVTSHLSLTVRSAGPSPR